jgi:hypothetical protein
MNQNQLWEQLHDLFVRIPDQSVPPFRAKLYQGSGGNCTTLPEQSVPK